METWDPSERKLVMDPDGDTIITLNNPRAPFAVSPSPASVDPAQGDLTSELDESTPYTFLVSSRHLILASPVFKKMLTGSEWSEAKKVDGQFRIEASEWDPRALSIVLNLVHGRHRLTPKSVTLESLAKIAAIVDYYEFHEAVEVICGSWVSTLRVSEPIPTSLERNLFLWMLGAWVFGLEDIFKSTTKAAILQTKSILEAPNNLPIQANVISKSEIISLTIVRFCATEADGLWSGRSDERESSSRYHLYRGRPCIPTRGLRARQKRVQLGMCLLSSGRPYEDIRSDKWRGKSTLHRQKSHRDSEFSQRHETPELDII